MEIVTANNKSMDLPSFHLRVRVGVELTNVVSRLAVYSCLWISHWSVRLLTIDWIENMIIFNWGNPGLCDIDANVEAAALSVTARQHPQDTTIDCAPLLMYHNLITDQIPPRTQACVSYRVYSILLIQFRVGVGIMSSVSRSVGHGAVPYGVDRHKWPPYSRRRNVR